MGTTFRLFFPRLHAEPWPWPGTTEQPAAQNKKVLLVINDEEMIVDVTKQSLERRGYAVLGFTSSVKALEAFRKEPKAFHLVITDHRMPGMTGVELARALIAIQPDIPIVLMHGL